MKIPSSRQVFYVSFAGVACKIIASGKWYTYLQKLYEGSGVLSVSEADPKYTYTALLTVRTVPGTTIKLEFVPKKKLRHYAIVASDDPLFLFPTVHQLIARILNIMFHLSGGFVLHASSVRSDNKVFVFVGPSGKGKSTIVDFISRHHPGSLILSDNSAFIRKIQGSFVIYPSPYLESNRLNTIQTSLTYKPPYIIHSAYFPFHASKNRVSQLPFQEKIKLLQKNSHIPYTPEHLFGKSEIRKFGNTIFSFIRTVPMYKLEFVKSPAFIYHIL